MNIQTFTVKGRGEFPLDMLRYDGCYPMTAFDVTCIMAENQWREVTLNRPVERKSSFGPTVKRWESFGWQVVDIKK